MKIPTHAALPAALLIPAVVLACGLSPVVTLARDVGHYAQVDPAIRQLFDSLTNQRNIPCCLWARCVPWSCTKGDPLLRLCLL